jgi:tetratricopeptide (TPR) repeat protein
MRLTGEQLPLGRDGRGWSPARLLALAAAIGGGLVLFWLTKTGQVRPLFVAGPTPTRTAASYADEGRTYFSAGNLPESVRAYQQAVARVPGDAELQADLARVQTYQSSLLPSAQSRSAMLSDARASIDAAVKANPDSGYAYSIRALVYDWSASAAEGDQSDQFLAEALNSAVRALQLETGPTPVHNLALAFQAEVLVDQQRTAEALDRAAQAAAQAPDLMDVHRVYGTVLQTAGQYRQSIEEFQKAADINPNLTFLYIQIGANYRRLRDIPRALEAFDRAARINTQLGIKDPTPYLSIGRTYLQDGEFFIAARNVEQALILDETNAQTWGFLGIVYYKARNYESAVDVLRCAADGCSQVDSRNLICQLILGCDPKDPNDKVAAAHGQTVTGLPLDQTSVEIYYTYNSALAYQGGDTGCADAERIAQKLMAAYGGDAIVAGIVAQNRDLCLHPPSTPASAPSASPTP